MLKLLGSILIIGASAALGLAVRQQAALRVRALAEWIDSLNLLILEVGGRSTPLHETFLIISRSRNQLIAPFFLELSKQISGMPFYDFRTVWNKALRAYGESWGLHAEEQNVLIGIADYLGRYDGGAQTQSLQTAMLRLQEQRDRAAEELRAKNSVYRTCGAAVGILLVLVLI